MAVFEHESLFACSPQGLFEFLTQPKNILTVSDPDLGIKFTSAPETLTEGAKLEFQIVSFGQVLEITHQVVRFSYPELVVEQQVAGPMKQWIHQHEYIATENGVQKIDRVAFEKPGGLIGFLLSDEKIIDQLEDGFHYRGKVLNELIERGVIQ